MSPDEPPSWGDIHHLDFPTPDAPTIAADLAEDADRLILRDEDGDILIATLTDDVVFVQTADNTTGEHAAVYLDATLAAALIAWLQTHPPNT